MRFVDTPGIITNKNIGRDNREDIKNILRAEIAKPNTKLCVLHEATEFAKNPVINFLDDSLDDGWDGSAKFIMPKFDKQQNDSRTAKKANFFFAEFMKRNICPHLVITATLDREDLPPDELFHKRNDLLAEAKDYERTSFHRWLEQHQRAREKDGSSEYIEESIRNKIGFPSAQAMMRKEMLEHTLEIIPVVIGSLQREMTEKKIELQDLTERQRFTNPSELKVVVNNLLHCLQERMTAYLDGDLLAAITHTDRLQTLDEEIEAEEDSMWADEELNHHTAKEVKWRSHIAEMEEVPEQIQPNMRFLGGKQVQRAIEFFGFVMIDTLPDPFELRDIVPNAVGYVGGGLMRENWEGATKQICMVLMRDITHPGINYLVKHIGYILHRLFQLAMVDIVEGRTNTAKLFVRFQLLPWNT
jgi:hypothetical protein